MSKKTKTKKDKKKFTGQVSKTRARKIFVALGFKTAKSWDEVQLTKKIKGLPNLADGTKLEPKMQKRVNVICQWIKDDKKVVVIDLDDVASGKKRAADVEDAVKRDSTKKAEKKAETAKKEKSANKKAAKKEKGKVQDKKAVAAKDNTDKFGSRKGTIKAAINSVLTKKPKTMEYLLKEAKVSNQQSGHLKNLIDDGYVVKTDKGYHLA